MPACSIHEPAPFQPPGCTRQSLLLARCCGLPLSVPQQPLKSSLHKPSGQAVLSLQAAQLARTCFTEELTGLRKTFVTCTCAVQLCETATSLKPMCRSAQGFQLELLQAELDKRGYAVELKVVAPDETFAAKQGPGHILENLHHQYLICSGAKAGNTQVSSSAESACSCSNRLHINPPSLDFSSELCCGFWTPRYQLGRHMAVPHAAGHTCCADAVTCVVLAVRAWLTSNPSFACSPANATVGIAAVAGRA